MSYLKLPLELDPETMVAEIYAEMQANFPGWEPAPGNPETFLIRAIVYRLIVPLAELAGDVADRVLEKFGEQLAGTPPLAAQKATASSTWKFLNEDGVTIRAGTQVNLPTAGDAAQGFVVVADVEVPPGSDETDPGEVLLEAIDAGAAANELSEDPELVDALPTFASLAIVGESEGGQDAEDPIVYLGRLAETMAIQAPRPIRASDVAILLRSIAGVQRVRVLDNYNHETEEDEQEKTLSAYPVDAAGLAVAEAIADACKALLEAKREVNFIFFVESPTYTKVNVNYEVVPREGFSQEAADAATEEALSAALSPDVFAADPNAADATPTTWLDIDDIRYQDLVTIVNNVPAVDHYKVLKVAKEGDALGTADVALPGPAPLPKPGVIQVGS